MDRRLEERSAIDFDRVIVRTRDLLGASYQVLAALRRRLKVLIVDEFQDVDPVQKQIAYLLGDPDSGRKDTTRLMLVGDPKQSIYRFRRADVAVWREVQRDFEERGHGLVISTPESFRCTAQILGLVDATIGKILDDPLDGEKHQGYEVQFESLTVGSQEKRNGPPVEFLVVPATDDGKDYRADQVRRIELTAVARRARELVDRREAEWGEMAVILPTWGWAGRYQEALEAVGAKAYSLRTTGFYRQREIVDLILALETIRDPWDDRALLGFLRSPFVGLKDETLLAIARQSYPPYWDGLDRVRVKEQALLDRGRRMLRDLVAMRDRVPTDELLECLIDEAGYMAHLVLLGDNRVQAVANVEKFLRQTRAASRLSVGELLQVIADARSREGEEGEVPLVPRTDAVTITTVHSAKGLQWKVVFWCDLVRSATFAENGDLLIGREGIALRDPDVERAEDQPEYWHEIKSEIERETYAERKRVWYVATTRAAERLILCGLPAGAMEQRRSRTVADHIWGVLGAVPLVDGAPFEYQASDDTAFDGVVRLADPSVLDDLGEERRDTIEIEPLDVLSGPLPPITAPTGRSRHSASELLTRSRCARKHWFKYVLGLREPDVARGSKDFIHAVTRGHIVHDVLQWLDEEDELDALLEDAIGRWDEHAPPPEAAEGARYRQHLREEIKSVADHPDYRTVADLSSARRELGFLHIADRDTFYQGHIDLAAWENGKFVLLDVKTSRANAAVARKRAEQYGPQRDVYVAATEGISGAPVGRFAFQFSRARVQVSDEILDDARDRLTESLRRAVSEMARGERPLTDHPAECRFCGYRKVGWCSGVDAEPPEELEGDSQLSFGL